MSHKEIESIQIDEYSPDISQYSKTKRDLLLLLKREGNLTLTELASRLNLSKMGVSKQLGQLESIGVVERTYLKRGRGRPAVSFQLGESSKNIFPRAYASLTISTLKFIKSKLGIGAIRELLQERKVEVLSGYKNELEDSLKSDSGEKPTQFLQKKKIKNSKSQEDYLSQSELSTNDKSDTSFLTKKVSWLAQKRDQEGYMVELKVINSDKFEMLEFNCPIFDVANEYWDACVKEQELFEDLLGVPVKTTHRVVAGNNVCRFLIG